MDKEEFFNRFYELFAGRRDVYAVGKPHRIPEKRAIGKLEYFPVWEPLTPEVLMQHVRGEKRVGVYPILEDHTVKWFALDFDGDTYEEAYTEAREQERVLENAGFQLYTERSQSGAGIHVWGFFSDWIDAAKVRAAVLPLFIKQTTGDRMFPAQPKLGAGDGKLGNLIALPFYDAKAEQQNSMFIDSTGAVINPKEFLSSVRYNVPEILDRITVPAGTRKLTVLNSDPSKWPEDPSTAGRPPKPIRGWLKAQSAYGCQFLNKAFAERRTLKEPVWYAAIQQATSFEHGREIAHAISRDYPGYVASEVDAKYDHACAQPASGCAYIKENFPEMACSNCPGRAPWQHAEKSLLELVQEAETGMEHGGYEDAIDLASKYDSGEIKAGVHVGLDGFDEYVTMRRGDLVLVAARPSMGKTAMMVDMSNRLAANGVPVLRFSAETGRAGLQARDLGWTADINTEALRGERRKGGQKYPLTAHEHTRLKEAADKLNSIPLYSNYTALDPDKILLIIENELLKNGIPLDAHYVVMFDYVQYGVKFQGESNYERVTRLSLQFKAIAKVLNCTVVALAQLGRGAEDEEPGLNDLKESGALEQDADVVILLHGERDALILSPRTVMIKKQREGRTGNLQFILHKDTCFFSVAHQQHPVEGPDGLPGQQNPFELMIPESHDG